MHHGFTPLAEEDIEKLQSEGITLTPHEILHIAFLGEQVMNPDTRQELARGRPVPIGSTYLWPLTLSAQDWYERVGCKLAITSDEVDMDSQHLSLGYAMAHGHAPLPENAREAVEAVKEWRRTKLHGTMDELKTAIEITQAQSVFLETGDDDDAIGRGELVLALTALTDVRPEVWEYQCSMSFTTQLIETKTAQCMADGKSIKEHRSNKALKALGLAVDRIRRRHQREQAANG
jgi:hypothetical protein